MARHRAAPSIRLRWSAVMRVRGSLPLVGVLLAATPALAQPSTTPVVGVAPQYDTTHVYVAQSDMVAFAASFTATFGGQSTKPVTMTVTPTPSSTRFEAVQTPAGPLSVFGFTTPIPYVFGAERTGYLVRDMDEAIA